MMLEEFYKRCDAIVPDANGCRHYLGVWGGGTIGNCYKVFINGRSYWASRVALQRKLGRRIRPKYQANHHCDVPSCVELSHLYEGTVAENSRDWVKRDPEAKIKLKQNISKAHLAILEKFETNPEFKAKRLVDMAKGRKAGAEATRLKFKTDPEYRERQFARLAKGRETMARKREEE